MRLFRIPEVPNPTDFPEIEQPAFPEIFTPRDPEPARREEPHNPDFPRQR
jgi:hypothetical protein